MVREYQIIVLHTIKCSNSGVVVQCYSNANGRESLFLRCSSKNGSKLSVFHKLNILDIVTTSNPKSNMATIKEYAQPYKLYSLRDDIYKNSISLFISELLYKILKESEQNTTLYNYICSSIQILEHLNYGVANFHLSFITHLCTIIGYKPINNYSNINCRFNIRKGTFVEDNTIYFLDKLILSKEISQLINLFLTTPTTNLESIELHRDKRYHYINSIILYIFFIVRLKNRM